MHYFIHRVFATLMLDWGIYMAVGPREEDRFREWERADFGPALDDLGREVGLVGVNPSSTSFMSCFGVYAGGGTLSTPRS